MHSIYDAIWNDGTWYINMMYKSGMHVFLNKFDLACYIHKHLLSDHHPMIFQTMLVLTLVVRGVSVPVAPRRYASTLEYVKPCIMYIWHICSYTQFITTVYFDCSTSVSAISKRFPTDLCSLVFAQWLTLVGPILNRFSNFYDTNITMWVNHVCHLMVLQWRHDRRYGVSNHQPHHCLLNHKWPVTWKMMLFDDVIMGYRRVTYTTDNPSNMFDFIYNSINRDKSTCMKI